MNLAEKFRRFAAECEAMSKCAKSPESRDTWDGMAARWILFAELADDRYASKVNAAPPRRRRSKYHYLN
jgi:hypothetical protein